MEVKTKICSRCKQNKSVEHFSVDTRVKSKITYKSRCRQCLSLISKEYRKSHKDKRDRVEYKKEYYQKNKLQYSAWNKEWCKSHNRSEYYRNYRNNNPSAKIASYCRNRIRNCIKKSWKSESSLSLTGCNSWKELKEYIESKFESDMNWENMGKWHIDHIRPCSSFDLTNPEQQKLCFHYSNLQPLWAKDNLKKSDNIM